MKQIKLDKLEQFITKCKNKVKGLVDSTRNLFKQESLLKQYYEYKDLKEKLDTGKLLDLTVIDQFTAEHLFGMTGYQYRNNDLGEYISKWITSIHRRRDLPVFQNYQWNYDKDGKHLKLESLNWSSDEDNAILDGCLNRDYGGSDYLKELAKNKEI